MSTQTSNIFVFIMMRLSANRNLSSLFKVDAKQSRIYSPPTVFKKIFVTDKYSSTVDVRTE